jgi:hypothetical protein
VNERKVHRSAVTGLVVRAKSRRAGRDGNRISAIATAATSLTFVLGDLRALLRKDPHTLALLLLTGYLHVGDTLSLKNGEPGDNRYARAAWALARHAGGALPEGTLDPLLPAPEPDDGGPGR